MANEFILCSAGTPRGTRGLCSVGSRDGLRLVGFESRPQGYWSDR